MSNPTPTLATRRLVRGDGPLGGVAAGLADYFDVDVTFVRLGLVVTTLIGFPTIPIAYAAAWLIIPRGDEAVPAPSMTPPPPSPVPPAPVPPVPSAPVPAPPAGPPAEVVRAATVEVDQVAAGYLIGSDTATVAATPADTPDTAVGAAEAVDPTEPLASADGSEPGELQR